MNVYKFTKTVHECESAKEAESYFDLLTNGTAKCIHVVRNSKKSWQVTVERWKAERMTEDEMAQAVKNMKREYGV